VFLNLCLEFRQESGYLFSHVSSCLCMGRIMTPRRETVFCKKCKSDKPLVQFSKTQRGEKLLKMDLSKLSETTGGGQGKSRALQRPTSIFMIISLTIYKHISVYVGCNIMSLMYVSLCVSQYSLLDVYMFVWCVRLCV
jgi:hypothetical protein